MSVVVYIDGEPSVNASTVITLSPRTVEDAIKKSIARKGLQKQTFVSFYFEDPWTNSKQVMLRWEDLPNRNVWRAIASCTACIFVNFTLDRDVINALLNNAESFEQIYVCNVPEYYWGEKGRQLFSL